MKCQNKPFTAFLGKLFTLRQLSYSDSSGCYLVCVRMICVSTLNIDIAQSILAIAII